MNKNPPLTFVSVMLMMAIILITISLLGWLLGSLLISWLAVGAITTNKYNIKTNWETIECYITFIQWPKYIPKNK